MRQLHNDAEPCRAPLKLSRAHRFLWMRHRACELYVTRSGVAALAARAMGSRSASHFYDQLLVKEPGTVAPTPWHNVSLYRLFVLRQHLRPLAVLALAVLSPLALLTLRCLRAGHKLLVGIWHLWLSPSHVCLAGFWYL